MQEQNFNPIRIISIDGSDIYRAMHRVDGEPGMTVKDEKGKLDTRRFRGFLDASLDTDQIKRVYAGHRELHGKFRILKDYTLSVVNVSFDYSVKEFYNGGKRIFVRDGYEVQWSMLNDHVYTIEEDGKRKLIAIEVARDGGKDSSHYTPVESPIGDELLGKFFTYDADKRTYHVRRKKKSDGTPGEETVIPVKKSKKEVREWLYKNGFYIDGIHYVRYKRSAGSSREGNCLFIMEPLYAEMMEWSSCGLDATTVGDQASWQAYISLTLSSIEKKIHIPRQSILIIKDQHSCFKDTVVRVGECDGGLSAEPQEVDIKNAIWDGEALLDKSVFAENGYATKGMMLLRNRFFKTCAFNTNLQQWFADNGITRLGQLAGYHSKRARSIEDIKLVITESSLKYLKFKPKDIPIGDWLEKWLDNIYVDKENSLFGVVKTDKATGPMGNRMVRTNYQLLNTLALSPMDVEGLLSQSLDFLHAMQNDPMYVRYHANLFVDDEYDEDEDVSTTENYRQRLISDIMRRTDNFEGTVFYRDYRSELCRSFKNRLKHGRILVDGGYHVLLGNCMEFLRAVIDKEYVVDEPLALVGGEIYAPRFADGEPLLCERSPHITMGNIFVATNRHVPVIDRYFNLGTSGTIVCVNAVKHNLQQRLNGCDYDSDSMLITDNPILLNSAIRNYFEFLVPYCDVEPGGSLTYTTSAKDLADLDVKISDNKIGEIVNLSQFLNSLYWDRLAHGDTEGLDGLYYDICKLAVLSGMEIDKAKRLYPVSADTVLRQLYTHKENYRRAHGGKVPNFFLYITESDEKDKGSEEARLDTAMSFVFDAVEDDRGQARRTKNVKYTSLFSLDFDRADPNGTYVKRRDSILEHVGNAQKRIRELNYRSKNKSRAERATAMDEAERLFEECKERVGKVADDHLYYLLLAELDRGEEEKRAVTAFHALLFAVICYANEGYLLKRLKKPQAEMLDLLPLHDPTLAEDDSEIVYIYGYPHIRGRKYH